MLTQTEADTLIIMRKRFVKPRPISFPPGTDDTYELVGDDPRERFLLDLWRGMLRLSKYKLQTRARKVIVLIRLDVGKAPHTNPDGQKIDGAHIHLYREGFEDRWAYPVDPGEFRNPSDAWTAIEDFCRFCHIEGLPPFQEVLM